MDSVPSTPDVYSSLAKRIMEVLQDPEATYEARLALGSFFHQERLSTIDKASLISGLDKDTVSRVLQEQAYGLIQVEEYGESWSGGDSLATTWKWTETGHYLVSTTLDLLQESIEVVPTPKEITSRGISSDRFLSTTDRVLLDPSLSLWSPKKLGHHAWRLAMLTQLQVWQSPVSEFHALSGLPYKTSQRLVKRLLDSGNATRSGRQITIHWGHVLNDELRDLILDDNASHSGKQLRVMTRALGLRNAKEGSSFEQMLIENTVRRIREKREARNQSQRMAWLPSQRIAAPDVTDESWTIPLGAQTAVQSFEFADPMMELDEYAYAY